MNILIDLPPDYVTIGGTDYEINSDFRTSILFELLIQDDSVEDQDKIWYAIDLYFKEAPVGCELNEVLDAILWFYKCGKGAKNGSESVEHDTEDYSEDSGPCYSFEYDDEYIYSAYMEQYGIDLTKANLHWWQFRAMFKGLNPDCQFCKIMGYRTTKITNEMSKAEKQFYKRMKKKYALPLSEKQQRTQDALADALLNGGDVNAVLNG